MAKKKPSLKQLTIAVKSTESSQWYNPSSQKGFSKAASATNKQCGKCDLKGHTSEECWGKCTYCGKFNHRSKRCFFKDAPKEDKTEKANKAQNKQKKKKKKKAKKATDRSDKQEKIEESESEYSEEESLVG